MEEYSQKVFPLDMKAPTAFICLRIFHICALLLKI